MQVVGRLVVPLGRLGRPCCSPTARSAPPPDDTATAAELIRVAL